MTSTEPSTAGLASPVGTPTTGRVQLALNVSDLQTSIALYSKPFGVGPAKVRPGYANFAVEAPPLKLVLLEGTGEELDTLTEDATECCFAVQDKVWVHDPDGAPWEVYTVLADAQSGCC